MPEGSEAKPLEVITDCAVHLSLMEVVVGSFIHAFKIPFGGNFLSLNQGLFLCLCTEKLKGHAEVYQAPVQVSVVAATLKSLSPAGNKLGPMVSISMQGLLFSLGTIVFGANLLGQTLGMILLSLWSFTQTIFTLSLFYGRDMVSAWQFYLDKMQDNLHIEGPGLFQALLFLVIGKAALAALIPYALRLYGYKKLEMVSEQLSRKMAQQIPQSHNSVSVGRAVWRELTKPFFLFSFALMTLFFVFTESSQANLIWKILRPLAIATLIFYLVHSMWVKALLEKLKTWPRLNPIFLVAERTQFKIRNYGKEPRPLGGENADQNK
jgi:hypothetical protein